MILRVSQPISVQIAPARDFPLLFIICCLNDHTLNDPSAVKFLGYILQKINFTTFCRTFNKNFQLTFCLAIFYRIYRI